ncbi:MAG: hypothetical protein K9N51_12725 [Candidatus Pacebacteria bacterium]|nr:hypothetical protein [Candidatus Paceibacterota bacterium]
MSDFEFNCPHCEQTLEAPEDMLGQTIECPACNGSIDLPAPDPEPVPPPRPAPKKKIVTKRRTSPSASSTNTKPCPYCGEPILSVAVKCKHCGSELTDGRSPTVQKSEAIGVIALILPICSAMVAWFWLSGMPLLFDPGSKLAMISIITIIATSILVAIEANTVGAGSKTDLNTKGKKREGPVTWFFGCILLWIVAFPAWMARRTKYGLKNLCFAAVLVGLIFAGVTGLMHYAIEEAKSGVRKSLEDVGRQAEQFQREMEREIGAQTDQFKEHTILNYLRMIDGAKEMWAMEFNKSNGAPVNKSNILPYLSGGFPTDPVGATYEIRAIGESPRCVYRGKTYTVNY